MKKTIIEKLLAWMELNLNHQSDFLAADVEVFFADNFTILTNNKKVEATPSTYRDYLYDLKARLVSVKY